MEDTWIRPNCNSLPWEVSNGLEEFCQTYSIGKTMAQTEPGDFEKKHRRMLHWNKDILAECIGKSFLCFSYFVFGGVFV